MAGKKLLVADDSLTIQKVIRLALSNEGYEIQAISDGADAIQQIATFRPHAVLIDVSLPTRSAFEIKREINAIADYREIKFILMSSAFEKIDESQAIDVSFDGRLTKPFDPAHLRQVLTEVLAAPLTPPSSLPLTPAPAKPFPSHSMSPPEMSDGVTGISLMPPKDLPPSDFDDEIWGKHEESADSSFGSPPLELPRETDDIKHLTESTIRLSGLADFPEPELSGGPMNPPDAPQFFETKKDDFDWTVNEPSLKPPSSFANLDGSDFQMFPPSGPSQQKPQSAPPLAPKMSPPTPSPTPAPPPRAPSSPMAPPPLPLTPPPEPHRFPQGGNFPADSIEMDERMEEVIRRQVEQTLEKLARQILPEVAERVLKEQINRLLNEKF